jgi:hypothetical protein
MKTVVLCHRPRTKDDTRDIQKGATLPIFDSRTERPTHTPIVLSGSHGGGTVHPDQPYNNLEIHSRSVPGGIHRSVARWISVMCFVFQSTVKVHRRMLTDSMYCVFVYTILVYSIHVRRRPVLGGNQFISDAQSYCILHSRSIPDGI